MKKILISCVCGEGHFPDVRTFTPDARAAERMAREHKKGCAKVRWQFGWEKLQGTYLGQGHYVEAKR
jgi:hypothetical protein